MPYGTLQGDVHDSRTDQAGANVLHPTPAIVDTAAALFYTRLFELDPALRPMFRGDLQAQGRKLIAMLRTVVTGLHRLDRLVPTLEGLGNRHLAYGVCDEHYAVVDAALLWTLRQGLGDAFTPGTEAAWGLRPTRQ